MRDSIVQGSVLLTVNSTEQVDILQLTLCLLTFVLLDSYYEAVKRYIGAGTVGMSSGLSLAVYPVHSTLLLASGAEEHGAYVSPC
jgi:hypothetical protein